MKVLQEQYNLIKEGKGNKAHFLKTAFRLFPDMLSPVNTFEDTVHILKNRSIISEGIGGVVTKGKTPDWHKIFKENIVEAAKVEEKEATKEVTDMETKGYDYKDKKNYDNVFGEEFLKGFYTEMGDSKNEGKTVEELRQIVAKNLAKDCNYYVKDGQFGLKGVGYTTEAPGLGTPKEAKGKFKSSGYGDLKESKHSDEADLKIYKSELKMLNKIKPTGEKQLKRKEELEEKIADLEKKMDKSYSSLKESVLRTFISEMVKEVLAENINSEDELFDIISKYVKDANDIEKELSNYYSRGYQGFSDALTANLSKDSEFQSWVQKGHDEETLKREMGEALTPEDEAEFTIAAEDAEQLYEKTGSVEGALKALPKEYNRFKEEIRQHLIQKYEGNE